MPKYVFKPSCSLSKKSKKERQHLRTSNENNEECNSPLINQELSKPIVQEVQNSFKITREPLSSNKNQYILENVELSLIILKINFKKKQTMKYYILHRMKLLFLIQIFFIPSFPRIYYFIENS